MNVKDIVFPVIRIHKNMVAAPKDEEYLTTTTSIALRAGVFDGLKVIDSRGKQFVVKSARKLHGVGLFWGFNIFLNRRIKVDLDLEDTGKIMTTDEVRDLVLKDFRNWHGWESRADFDELKASVEKATSVAEVIRLVAT